MSSKKHASCDYDVISLKYNQLTEDAHTGTYADAKWEKPQIASGNHFAVGEKRRQTDCIARIFV